ncbi:MAG: hypothetical protein JO334_19045 [Verrucomicrobia bacterium]|nr:hypothetical protein [Verrucomicrobiota bacterium]
MTHSFTRGEKPTAGRETRDLFLGPFWNLSPKGHQGPAPVLVSILREGAQGRRHLLGVVRQRHTGQMLVYRLLNPLSFAVGQLAVFQGASDEHI